MVGFAYSCGSTPVGHFYRAWISSAQAQAMLLITLAFAAFIINSDIFKHMETAEDKQENAYRISDDTTFNFPRLR